MPGESPREGFDNEFWENFLHNGGDSFHAIGRQVLRRIPSEPRCRMCAAPFSGIGAPAMRLIGKRPSNANPTWCSSCANFMLKHHGGAEVEVTLLFADIRGSTTVAEGISSADYHALLDRFYTTTSRVIFAHDGLIDKFVGDEVIALFFLPLTGEHHVTRAVEAAQAILRATGHEDSAGPWAPVGAGVHTGPAWFGAVGEGKHTELTVVGDNVNIAARLAANAKAGEVLVSAAAADGANLDPSLPRTTLDLKGKLAPTDVVTLKVGGERPAATAGDRG